MSWWIELTDGTVVNTEISIVVNKEDVRVFAEKTLGKERIRDIFSW